MNPERKKELRQHAAFWEAERRRKYTGGGHPPLVYDFRPPFLFDCRLNCARRMGIGDHICLVSAIQMVADKVGRHNVTVAYNPTYPGSTDVFGMSGLATVNYPDAAAHGATLIPCRGHIMESPIGCDMPCLYGEEQGNPIAQILYNWGWHILMPLRAVRLRLYPGAAAIARAREIAIAFHAGGVCTCTPLEVSRGNDDCDWNAWSAVLRRVDAQHTILFGCAPAERGKIAGAVAAMRLPHRTAIIAEPLATWRALIDVARKNFTGNSSGMWLAIGSRARTTLLQHSCRGHAHNAMWDLKPSWGCQHIEVINV